MSDRTLEYMESSKMTLQLLQSLFYPFLEDWNDTGLDLLSMITLLHTLRINL
jgi:hypothetical protein